MIARKAVGADNNPAGSSAFVGITQPAGVADGDLLLVAITVCAAGVTVAPPDSTWTLVYQSDPAQACSVSVFWKTALDEPVRWVFALSASADAVGAVVVYGGADGWEPIEANTTRITPVANPHNTPPTATSMGNEVLVLFLGANQVLNYSAATSYLVAKQKTNVGTTFHATLCVQDRSVAAAGAIAAGTVAYTGTNALGVAVLIVLNPTAGKLSLDQVRNRFVKALPKGADKVYDLTLTGDYFKLFQIIGQLGKVLAFDLIDRLNVEKYVSSARYLLATWENAFGLSASHAARVGTVPQRQAQVVAAWRAAAGQGSSIPAIQAVLGPILGYATSTPVEVLACSRSELDIKHRYSPDAVMVIGDGSTSVYNFTTVDGGKVSTAGARLTLEYGAGAGAISVTLSSPDGTSKIWAITIASSPIDLVWAKELAGVPMTGRWTVSITNSSGGSISVIPTVIVEGVCAGLNDRQNTGAAIFHWGVYADPAHLGENGVPADFDSARRAIQRLNFAHTVGNLIQSKAPYPGTASGVHCSIPGECIPCAN